MVGNSIGKNLLIVGNVIKNVINEDENPLDIGPDIMTSGKITRLMSNFVIMPNVIVDESLRYMDATHFSNMVKTEVKVFTAFLTQAFKVMTELYGVTPHMAVSTLGRKSKADVFEDINRVEDLIKGLEGKDYMGDLMFGEGFLPVTEDRDVSEYGDSMLYDSKDYITKGKNPFINVYEVQLRIETKSGNERIITIPIIIYPNIMFTNAETLAGNILDNDDDKSVVERFHSLRAGVIGLADLVFATDLIKQYKERKITNPNDLATYLNRMDKTTMVNDILHNRKTFSNNYNLYIFDAKRQAQMEKRIRGSVLKDKYKDKLTGALSAFSISFVDTEREDVTILIDDIPGFSVLGYKMLKQSEKDEIGDIVKALMNNRSPF